MHGAGEHLRCRLHKYKEFLKAVAVDSTISSLTLEGFVHQELVDGHDRQWIL